MDIKIMDMGIDLVRLILDCAGKAGSHAYIYAVAHVTRCSESLGITGRIQR
jgi:hypothetical protein